MSTPILLFGYFAAVLGSQYFSKQTSNRLAVGGKYGNALFLTINSTVACIFFAATTGFNVPLPPMTAVFAVIYAAVVLLNLFSNIKVLQRMEVANVQVINSACSLIVTATLGFTLFEEEYEHIKLVRIVLMLVAFAVIFSERKGQSNGKSRFSPALLGLIAATVGNYLVLKYYGEQPNVASSNSLFFWTNVIHFGIGVTWFLCSKPTAEVFKGEHSVFKFRTLFPFAASNISSDASALVSVVLIDLMETSVYTPVSSAILILCGLAASVLFREKLGWRSLLAATLAIIAVVI